MKKTKKALIILFLVLGALLLWQWKLVSYGLMQARGQFRVISGSKPVEHYLNLEDYPDSLKQKLRLIQEVKQYAFDSLGINQSENYSTMYDQGGKPILWNLSACEPFALKAKTWGFPLLGSFSYKGFFELERAQKERQKLVDQGFDTRIRSVGGWSTLGWFKDPILSNMLNRSNGRLAELIIHELTHGTLYIKDSVAYNENLATFIGEKGARQFLIHKYGEGAPEHIQYLQQEEDAGHYSDHILRGAVALDSLYNSLGETETTASKQQKKDRLINHIVSTLDTIQFHNADRYRNYFKNALPNNTYFMSFLRYRSKQDNFEVALQQQFNGNLKDYLTNLKEKYPSL